MRRLATANGVVPQQFVITAKPRQRLAAFVIDSVVLFGPLSLFGLIAMSADTSGHLDFDPRIVTFVPLAVLFLICRDGVPRPNTLRLSGLARARRSQQHNTALEGATGIPGRGPSAIAGDR